jgi:hypothetical protein
MPLIFGLSALLGGAASATSIYDWWNGTPSPSPAGPVVVQQAPVPLWELVAVGALVFVAVKLAK